MTRRPTYEELEQRVKELEEQAGNRKETEEELRTYQFMIESAHDAIFFKDLKSRYINANDKTLEAFGLPKEDVIGRNDYELMPDQEEAETNVRDDQIVFETGKPTEVTKHMTGADGKECWFQAIKVPKFDNNGKVIGLVGIARDITRHKQTKEALIKAQSELEHRVKERTRELEIESKNLEEANIAMKVLLKKREEDKKDIENNILTNVGKLIDPYFEKIRKTKLDSQQEAFLNIMESNLREITSQFARNISLRELNLTPSEIQVANMIRLGNSSKVMAEIINISVRTVDTHRRNIRKKMGLNQKRANLRSYLLSLH